jgi:hypothetical protein
VAVGTAQEGEVEVGQGGVAVQGGVEYRRTVASQSPVARNTFHQNLLASGSGLSARAAARRPSSRHWV